jgi:hypothetical protein
MRLKHKHLLTVFLLAGLLLGSVGGFLVTGVATADSPSGTCQHDYRTVRDGSTSITTCTKADYTRILADKPSGVTKSNYKGFCYLIVHSVFPSSDTYSIDTVGCTSLTRTKCLSSETGTAPNCVPKATDPTPTDPTTPDDTTPVNDTTGDTAPIGDLGTCTAADPGKYCNSDPALKCGTTSSKQCDFVAKYVNPAIALLSVAFGLFATISIILGGIAFATSAGDPQKASKAKARITNTVIAVVAYMFLYAFLQFLIPGGLFR